MTLLKGNVPNGFSLVTLSTGEQLLFLLTPDGSEDGIWVQRYDTHGNEAAPLLLVATEIAGDPSSLVAEEISGDRVLVTWRVGTEIFGQIVDQQGVPQGDAIAIGDFTNTSHGTNNGVFEPEQDIVQLADSADGDGGFLVTWHSYAPPEEGDEVGFGVLARQFNADGTPQGDVFLVNTETYSWQLRPNALALPDGGYVVTWSAWFGVWGEDRDAGIFGQVYNADGSPRGPEFHVNSTTHGAQTEPRVLSSGEDGFTVFWLSSQGIFFQEYNGEGGAIGAETQLDLGSFADGTAVSGPSGQSDWDILALDDGGYTAVWRNDASAALTIQSFDTDGTPLGDALHVATINTHGSRKGFVFDIEQNGDELQLVWENTNTNEVHSFNFDAPTLDNVLCAE